MVTRTSQSREQHSRGGRRCHSCRLFFQRPRLELAQVLAGHALRWYERRGSAMVGWCMQSSRTCPTKQNHKSDRTRENGKKVDAPVPCRDLRARATALCVLICELMHSGRRQLVNGHSSSHSLVASTDTSSAAECGCVSRRRPGDKAVIGPIRRSAATESTLIGVWSENTIAVVQLQGSQHGRVGDGGAMTGGQVLVHDCGRRSGSGQKVRLVAEPPTSDNSSM